MKKRVAVMMALVMTLLAFTGCKKADSTSSDNTSAAPVTTAAVDTEKPTKEAGTEGGDIDLSGIRACAFLSGPRGDSGTVDMICIGLENLRDQYGLDITIIEAGDGSADIAKLKAAFYDCCDMDFDIILTNSSAMNEIMAEAVPQYPDTLFSTYDTVFDFETYPYDNLYCCSYKQNEGAYLAGVLGMSMSKNGMIGFVGGQETTTICDFMVGYVEGAKYVKEDGKINISFTGDWYNSAKAKEIALTQVSLGADVLFPAAGPSSEGVMEAAAEKNVYSIGVDIDRAAQYSVSNPDWVKVILSSELKNVASSVERTVLKYHDGTLLTGEVEYVGIKEGGVGIVKDSNYETLVPQDVRDTIEDVEKKVISGEIVIQSAYDKSAEELQKIKDWAK